MVETQDLWQKTWGGEEREREQVSQAELVRLAFFFLSVSAAAAETCLFFLRGSQQAALVGLV